VSNTTIFIIICEKNLYRIDSKVLNSLTIIITIKLVNVALGFYVTVQYKDFSQIIHPICIYKLNTKWN
jgi:hypothetical protein